MYNIEQFNIENTLFSKIFVLCVNIKVVKIINF